MVLADLKVTYHPTTQAKACHLPRVFSEASAL